MEQIDKVAPKKGKVKLTQLDANRIQINALNFKDNVAISYYNIYLNGKLIGKSNQASYIYKGVLGGKMSFSVEAVDAAGNKSKKVKSSIKVKDMVAPSQVGKVGVSGVATQKSTVLTWATPVDNVKVTNYLIYVDGKTYKSKKNSLKIKNLAAGDHKVSVIAMDKAKNKSVVSNTYTFNVKDSTAPKKGKVKLTQLDKSSIQINMTGFSDNVPGFYYNIYLNGKLVATTKNASYTYKDAKIGGKMTFSVEAVDAAGNKAKMVKSSITVKDMVAPSQVNNVRLDGDATNKATTITWDAATDNVGVTSYLINVDGKTYTSKKTSLTIKKLAEGNHTVTVIAVDKAKNKSAASANFEFAINGTVSDPVKPSDPETPATTKPAVGSVKDLTAKKYKGFSMTDKDDTVIASNKDLYVDGNISLKNGNDTVTVKENVVFELDGKLDMGAGNNSLTVNKGSYFDIDDGLFAGSGNDTVKVIGAGFEVDNIDLAAGNDKFIVSGNGEAILPYLNTGAGDDVIQIDAGSVIKFDYDEDSSKYGLNMGDGNDTLILNGKIILDYNTYYGNPKSKDWFVGIEKISGTGSVYVETGVDYPKYINDSVIEKFENAGIEVHYAPNAWAYSGNESKDDTLGNATVVKYDWEYDVWLNGSPSWEDAAIDRVDWFQLNIGGDSGISTKDTLFVCNGYVMGGIINLEVCDKNGNVIKKVDGSALKESNNYCAPVLDLNTLGNGTYYLKFSMDENSWNCGAVDFSVCNRKEWDND